MNQVTEEVLKALEEKAKAYIQLLDRKRGFLRKLFTSKNDEATWLYLKAVDPELTLSLISTIRELRRENRVRERALENRVVYFQRRPDDPTREDIRAAWVADWLEEAQSELEKGEQN